MQKVISQFLDSEDDSEMTGKFPEEFEREEYLKELKEIQRDECVSQWCEADWEVDYNKLYRDCQLPPENDEIPSEDDTVDISKIIRELEEQEKFFDDDEDEEKPTPITCIENDMIGVKKSRRFAYC